jgi:hypothetical protein
MNGQCFPSAWRRSSGFRMLSHRPVATSACAGVPGGSLVSEPLFVALSSDWSLLVSEWQLQIPSYFLLAWHAKLTLWFCTVLFHSSSGGRVHPGQPMEAEGTSALVEMRLLNSIIALQTK